MIVQVGIDGNQWYCSNGICLGDHRSVFEFGDTLQAAFDAYKQQDPTATISPRFAGYMLHTVAEYKNPTATHDLYTDQDEGRIRTRRPLCS